MLIVLYVEDDSMSLKHLAGELVFVPPERPVRIGASIVLQYKKAEEDYSEEISRILHKHDTASVEVEKLNPAAFVKI